MRMSPNTRLGAGALAIAIMLVLVVVIGYRERPVTEAALGTPWLPALQAQLADVRRITLRSSGETTTLVRNGNTWGVVERDAYPADFKRLEALLDALASAKRVEQKTAKPEYYERLGLSDIEKPDSEAVQVEIWAQPEDPVVSVLIGRAADARRGRYVREVTASDTWLIDTAPEPQTDPAAWIDRRLLDVDFSRVAAVTRSVEGAQGFTASRASAGEASLAVASLPAGKAPRYLSVFDAAARSILTAEPEDVRKASSLDFSRAAVTAITCFDGLGLAVRAIKAPDGNWVSLEASAGPTGAPTPVDAAANPVPTALPEASGAAEQAQALDGRLSGWAYRVSDYVYGELAKGLNDYIQDQKPAASGRAAEEHHGEH